MIVGIILIALFVYLIFFHVPGTASAPATADPTLAPMTISGTYGCLPYRDASAPQTAECAFGIRTTDGVWYAVNFGQSARAAEQFRASAQVVAEGFAVPLEALSTDHWSRYDMAGIFTVTRLIEARTP